MWARVKYRLDGQVLNRPLTFFKDYEEVEKELKEKKVRSEYWVFWSDKVNETPTSLIENEKQIIDVETVVWSLDDVPIAGMYRARLLNYAANEEALLKLLATPQGRRTVKVTIKTPKKVTSIADKRKLKNDCKTAHNLTMKRFCYDVKSQNGNETELNNQIQSNSIAISSKEVDKPNVKTRKQHNSNGSDSRPGSPANSSNSSKGDPEQVTKATKPVRSSRTKKSVIDEKSDSEESCSDDQDGVPYVQHYDTLTKLKELKVQSKALSDRNSELSTALEASKEDVKYLKERCSSLEDMNEGLVKEVKELSSLNKYWQEEEMKRRARHSTSKHGSSSRSSSSSVSKYSSTERHKHRDKSPAAKKTLQLASPVSTPASNPASVSSRCVSPTFEDLANDFQCLEDDNLVASNVKPLDVGEPKPDAVEQRIGVLPSPPVSQPSPVGIKSSQHTNDVKLSNKSPTKGKLQDSPFTQQQIAEYLEREDDGPAFNLDLNCDSGRPLTWAQFKSCRLQGMKNKRGEVGDPMFVKNVAGILWSAEELVTRSGTGRQGTTSTVPGRPQSTPEKRQYCCKLLEMRIYTEEEVSEEQFRKRTNISKINKYLGEKIKAARRSAGLKDET